MNKAPRSPAILIAGSLFLFAFFAAVLFSRAVNYGLSHDEYQFVASGLMFARGFALPYRDYPFLHMPYMPILNGTLFLAGGNAIFLARLLNAGFGLSGLALTCILIWRSYPDSSSATRTWMTVLGSLLILFNPATIFMDGRAINYAAPELVSLLGYAAFLHADRARIPARWILLSGAAVGLATGLRLNFAVTGLPFLCILLLAHGERTWRARARDCFSFCLGAGAALFPAGLLFLSAPEKAFYGNFTYIRLNTTYRAGLLHDEAMTIVQKLVYFEQTFLSNPASLLLFLLAMGLGWTAIRNLIRSRGRESVPESLALGLGAVLLATAFAPTPLWPQYFYNPIPYLVLGVMVTFARGIQKKKWVSFLLGLGLALSLIFNPWGATLRDLAAIFDPAVWVPLRVNALSTQIKQQVSNGKVLTLAPIFPLQAGLDVYPVFTPGPFSWRTAPILSPEKRQRLGLVAPVELAEVLAQDPPAAILTGPEKNYEGFSPNDWQGLERPLIQYAEANGYSPHPLACELFEDCTLWLKK